MDKVSILHAFPSESTFLADVPSSILRRPVEAAHPHGSGDISSHKTHEAFMSALYGAAHPSRSWTHEGGGGKELSVMRVVSIKGSLDFHGRFLADCESYCRLCCRLRHAADWLLLKRPRQKSNGASTGTAAHASDVDSLSHVVYPLEPTAFLAAAFALPSLVSISSSLPGDEEFLAATATDGRRGGAPSPQFSRTVPYCFFYGAPMQRLLRTGDDGGHSCRSSRGRGSGSGGAFFPDVLQRSLMDRVTAIANTAGICGCVSPVHNTLSVHNRTKIGLTLSAYMSGRLPRSVTIDAGGASAATPTAQDADPFSRWRDDILWRLLGLLVSALAVLHASGFHYYGELSADDILCFALPNNDDDEDDVTGETTWQEGTRGSDSIGQRLNGWVKGNQRRWLITEATPAHRAFFMFAKLPQSLFVEGSKDPSELAAAQRRDTAAVGRIVLTAVEETKRRRGAKGMNSCSELIFVAERMAAVEDGGDRMVAADAPAHRFAQLQAVQLRTYLWLLRAIVDERDAQLAAAVLRKSGPSAGTESKDHWSPSRLFKEGEVFMEKLNERDRLLSEREEKLNRFLVLYELTAERLDELPVKKDGFDLLKRSLLQKPLSQPPEVARAPSPTLSGTTSTWSSGVRQPHPKTARRPATTATKENSPSDPTRPPYGLLRFSKDGTAGSAPASAPTAASSSRSMAVFSVKGKQSPDPRSQQWTSRVTSEASSRRSVVLPSSPSLLHLNWKRVSSILAREGVATAAATARSPNPCRRNSALAGTTGRASTPRIVGSSALATAAGGGGASTAKEKPSARPMPVKRGVLSTASTQLQPRQSTPARGQQQSSILLSPDVSPLARVAEDTSSSLLAAGYKTPPRASSMSTPLQSRGSPTPNTLNKMLTPHSTNSTTQGSTPRRLHNSVSSRGAKELKMSPDSALGLSQVTGHLPGATPKSKSPCYNPLLYMAPPDKDITLPTTPDRPLPAVEPATSPPSATKGPTTPPFAASNSPLRGNSSVQVINMQNYSGKSLSPDNSREMPPRRHRGDGVSACSSAKIGTPNNRPLNGTHRPVSNDGAPPPWSLTRSHDPMDEKQLGMSQRGAAGQPRPSCRQEQEEKTTPRASRARLVNDGWVNHHLEALEQLRYDFQQSEISKSARSTPSGKLLVRSVRGPSAAGVEASAPTADRGRNGDVPTWGGGGGQAAAAQATSNGAKLMY